MADDGPAPASSEASAPGSDVPPRKSFLREVGGTGVLVLLFARFFTWLSLLALWPSMPYIYTNFFASRAAGEPMKCELFPAGEEPVVRIIYK